MMAAEDDALDAIAESVAEVDSGEVDAWSAIDDIREFLRTVNR